MTPRGFAILVTAVLWPLACSAVLAQPVVTSIEPWSVQPGATNSIVVTGKKLADASVAWCSSPELKFEFVPAKSSPEKAAFTVTASGKAPVGVIALRLGSRAGVSKPALMMVDGLPAIAATGTNRTPDKAHVVTPPIAVDGRCDAEAVDFYRFSGKAGQPIDVEVVAQRLGSPLDATLKLVDPAGRTIAECDDVEGLGSDARITAVLPVEGDYTIEVRDARYSGGPMHRYHLRLGGGFISTERPLPPLPRISEKEPNDHAEQAMKVKWPCMIAGRFDAPKDRDWYTVDVPKGTTLRLTPMSASLGSPAMVYMRVTDAAGKQLSEWVGANPKAEPLVQAFASAGSYRIMVEELSNRGGPTFTYALAITEAKKDFALSTAEDTLAIAAGSTAKLKVDAARRGDSGPIKLAIEGQPNWALKPDAIAKGKNDAEVTISVPAEMKPGVYIVKLIGRGEAKDAEPVIASTLPALAKQWPNVRFPPQVLDGQIAIAVLPRGEKVSPPKTSPSDKKVTKK
jgi:hypothetical protein